jgi:hypothetical protein
MNKRDYPVLLAEPAGPVKPDGTMLVKAWCPFCKCHHNHGWDDVKDRKAWHRVAHCNEETPFKVTGYMLKPAWKVTRDGGLA